MVGERIESDRKVPLDIYDLGDAPKVIRLHFKKLIYAHQFVVRIDERKSTGKNEEHDCLPRQPALRGSILQRRADMAASIFLENPGLLARTLALRLIPHRTRERPSPDRSTLSPPPCTAF
jgi:hypothetical protein